jgi:hypothetical protein
MAADGFSRTGVTADSLDPETATAFLAWFGGGERKSLFCPGYSRIAAHGLMVGCADSKAQDPLSLSSNQAAGYARIARPICRVLLNYQRLAAEGVSQ